MEYYGLLGFGCEPFSNSPDPNFFYGAEGHLSCLHRLEIALRLRRGLNIVLGEVGLGKTTVCRQLLRSLHADEAVETHLLLDPSCQSQHELLCRLHELLCNQRPEADASSWDIKEAIKHSLLTKAENEVLVALFIDEGQKLSAESLELLRELLNFETNTAKLLQIVIFAQPEFQELLEQMHNVKDRINEYITISPLNLAETKKLVMHRMSCASIGGPTRAPRFSSGAFRELHRQSKGHPRQIITLCHKIMLGLIMQDRQSVSARLVKSCARSQGTSPHTLFKFCAGACAAALVVISLFLPSVQKYTLPYAERLQAALAEHLTSGADAPPVSAPVATQTRESFLSGSALPMHPAENLLHDGLGSVQVPAGASLSKIMAGVYGRYTDDDLENLLVSNESLRSPSDLSPGQTVCFPPPQAYPSQKLPRRIWLEYARTGTLQSAYESLRTLGPEFRILVHSSQELGCCFSLVERRAFLDIRDAESALHAHHGRTQRIAPIGLIDSGTRGMLFYGGLHFPATLHEQAESSSDLTDASI